jgi:hypothetical protein
VPLMGTTLRPNGRRILESPSRTTTVPCWSILSVRYRRLSTLTAATAPAVAAAVVARAAATVVAVAPRAMVCLPAWAMVLHLLRPALLLLLLLAMELTSILARSPCAVPMRPSRLDTRTANIPEVCLTTAAFISATDILLTVEIAVLSYDTTVMKPCRHPSGVRWRSITYLRPEAEFFPLRSLMSRARMRISCFPSGIAFSKPCISLCSRRESSHCEMVHSFFTHPFPNIPICPLPPGHLTFTKPFHSRRTLIELVWWPLSTANL